MTEPRPDLSWAASRRELRVTVRPPEDLRPANAKDVRIDSVDLLYRCEPSTAAETGVPENGWAYAGVEVFGTSDWGSIVNGPRRLVAVYDETALNSPLANVPDWIYALLHEHEPPLVGELEASAEDAWRTVHEQERELAELRGRLTPPVTFAAAADPNPPLDEDTSGALQALYVAASDAVSRAVTMAHAIGLAARQPDEELDPEAVRAVAEEADEDGASPHEYQEADGTWHE